MKFRLQQIPWWRRCPNSRNRIHSCSGRGLVRSVVAWDLSFAKPLVVFWATSSSKICRCSCFLKGTFITVLLEVIIEALVPTTVVLMSGVILTIEESGGKRSKTVNEEKWWLWWMLQTDHIRSPVPEETFWSRNRSDNWIILFRHMALHRSKWRNKTVEENMFSEVRSKSEARSSHNTSPNSEESGKESNVSKHEKRGLQVLRFVSEPICEYLESKVGSFVRPKTEDIYFQDWQVAPSDSGGSSTLYKFSFFLEHIFPSFCVSYMAV